MVSCMSSEAPPRSPRAAGLRRERSASLHVDDETGLALMQ